MMTSHSKVTSLDIEEKDLQDSLDKLDINTLTKPSIQEQQKFITAAKGYVKKETKMNIRIDPFELEEIKKCAKAEGLKYQTFIKSILHKYISGELIKSKNI
jgi:predicted DNA binding CopG/RHH family protein